MIQREGVTVRRLIRGSSLVLATLLSLGSLAAQKAKEATLESKLAKIVSHFDSASRPLIPVLVQIAYENHLPMGIEYATAEAATRPISLDVYGRSVREILSAAVARIPGLQVSYSNGLVSVYSSVARQDHKNLLNTRIPEFSIVDADTQDAGAELTCALARTVDPGTGCFASIAKGQWGSLKVSVSVQSAPVREILDRIVAQNGDAIWTVTVPPEKLSALPIIDMWHIYPLQPQFENVVQAKLTEMFTAGAGRQQQ